MQASKTARETEKNSVNCWNCFREKGVSRNDHLGIVTDFAAALYYALGGAHCMEEY